MLGAGGERPRSTATQRTDRTTENAAPASRPNADGRGLASGIALTVGALAALWQAVSPRPGWLAVLILAAVVAAATLASGARPRFRGQDAWLGAFLLTAGVGVWAAFDRGEARSAFLLIVTSVLVYYGIAIQPIRRMGLLGGIGLAAASGVAAVFLLSHDWLSQPAEFDWLNRLAGRWMAFRPALTLPQLTPNTAGGLIAGLMPLGMLVFAPGAGLQRWSRNLICLGAGAVCVAGLALSSSRGAWIALGAGALVGIVWYAQGAARPRAVGGWQAGLIALVILTCCSWLALGAAQRLAPTLDTVLPGAASAQSRSSLAGQALDLVADFPYTGGGLGAFAVLYSRYVMVFPWFYYGYAHSLSLDVAISQGLGGLIALTCVLCLSVQAALQTAGAEPSGPRRRVVAATLAGLVVLVVHGAIDDPFYASHGVVLLFLYPGMASALAASGARSAAEPTGRKTARLRRRFVAGVAFAGLLLAVFWAPVRSRWLSDLASVALAREELADWPAEAVGLSRPIDADGAARRQLQTAVRLDPTNRTAHQRLGILALNRGDFTQAVDELEAAWGLDADHRGVRKTLGYALVWSGNLGQALPLLREIPEAQTEMGFFAWWWRTQGRQALADRSAQMEDLLLRQTGERPPGTSGLSARSLRQTADGAALSRAGSGGLLPSEEETPSVLMFAKPAALQV